jgi:hypothetical protein
MNTSRLKTQLHESIENINDEKLLFTLSEISSHHYSIVEEPMLDDYQVNRLKESKEQVSKGNFFSNEQADELIAKWLKK